MHGDKWPIARMFLLGVVVCSTVDAVTPSKNIAWHSAAVPGPETLKCVAASSAVGRFWELGTHLV